MSEILLLQPTHYSTSTRAKRRRRVQSMLPRTCPIATTTSSPIPLLYIYFIILSCISIYANSSINFNKPIEPSANSRPESSSNENRNTLSRHIRHFEPLNYDHHDIHRRATQDLENNDIEQRRRRQVGNQNTSTSTAGGQTNNTPTKEPPTTSDSNTKANFPIEVDFQAHNRHFKLRLKPDVESVFGDGAVIENGQGDSIKHNINHRLFSLTGHLHEQPDTSKVYGSLKRGIFEGTIHTPENDVFYVERARKYVDDLKEHNPRYKNLSSHQELNFHSVIYSAEDVQHPHHTSPPTSSIFTDPNHKHNPFSHIDQLPTLGSACGEQNEQIKDWMRQISSSAVPGSEREHLTGTNRTKTAEEIFHERMSHMYKYSLDEGIYHLNESTTSPYTNSHRIKARDNWLDSTCSNQTEATRTVSRLKRQADIFDFNLLSPKPRISHRPPSEQPQRQKRACTLYIQTDTYLWNHTRRHHDNDLDTREDIASLVAQHIKAVNHIYENSDFGGVRGLKFIVQRLRINDTSACEGSRRASNPFCQPNIDVSNFLNLNSQFNHNDFCLAYIFTYRDFSGGTLGLAWVASTSGASGGICEKYKSYTENVNGRQVQTKRSLNTGIITFVNYNSRVPPKVSELTLAHEIGHNFGSPHDFPADCRPGGPQGNFIMYSSATSGERSNNNKFSSCSIRNISSVLHAILAADSKDNCFEVDNGPFCGNKIVEEGEECDCGYNAQECTEQCCVPREVSLDIDYGGSRSCQRVRGKECSPSEGPCCSDDCSFAGREKLCRQETECSHQQSCDATQASCPEPAPKANMTECNNGTQVCMNGKCGGSICMKYNMEECFLTAKTGAKPEDMCEVACQQPNDTNTCRRTSEIPEMRHMSGLKLRPGSPCNEFLGYCDVFQRCRPVDAEGPLARLKNTLLNQRTLTTIKQWAITHWWACALFAIGFMMLMYVFIECCAVHTPTSNPKKKPALRFSDTIRHPANTLRRKRHAPAAGWPRPVPNGRSGGDGYLFRA